MENINKYKEVINCSIKNNFLDKIESSNIKEICNHALLDGKRLRPMITLDIINTLNKKNNTGLNGNLISIAVELFHTACLIIDDLPCMDNDLVRRGKETIHAKYGETASQLIVSYLLSECYRLISNNLDDLFKNNLITKKNSIEIKLYMFNNLSEQIGESSFGQFMDIFPKSIFNDGNIEEEIIRNIIKKKTTPFFEVAFVGGYIIGNGGIIKNYEIIKEIADLFGLAYQIFDDFDDQIQDLENSKNNIIQNYVIVTGKENAYERFNNTIDELEENLNKLDINSDLFKEIINYLTKKVNENYKLN